MQFSTILFDFDGTLIDSDPMIKKTFELLYSIYKPDYEIDEKKIDFFSGGMMIDIIKKEFEGLNVEKIYEDYLKYSETFYQDYVTLFEGALPLLKELKRLKIKLGLVTSKRRMQTELAIKMLNLDNIFDVVVTPEEIKENKPSPEGLLLAMQKLGVRNKEEVLMVGDTKYDYLAAKAARISFALVSWSPRGKGLIDKVDYLIPSFASFFDVIKK